MSVEHSGPGRSASGAAAPVQDPVEALDRTAILAALDQHFGEIINNVAGSPASTGASAAVSTLASNPPSPLAALEIVASTASTNADLLARPAGQRHAVARLAERQVDGRGRRGRRWHSPAGGNLYLSLGWEFARSPLEFACLPLALAVALARSMRAHGWPGLKVKWPNDLLLNDRKVGGLLLESVADVQGGLYVVIGLGLNVRMPPGAAIARPWTDLASTVPEVSRNQVAGLVLGSLLAELPQFEQRGFAPLRIAWAELDACAGSPVTIERAEGPVTGIARGPGPGGGLLLETGNGLQEFTAGEISVRIM